MPKVLKFRIRAAILAPVLTLLAALLLAPAVADAQATGTSSDDLAHRLVSDDDPRVGRVGPYASFHVGAGDLAGKWRSAVAFVIGPGDRLNDNLGLLEPGPNFDFRADGTVLIDGEAALWQWVSLVREVTVTRRSGAKEGYHFQATGPRQLVVFRTIMPVGEVERTEILLLFR